MKLVEKSGYSVGLLPSHQDILILNAIRQLLVDIMSYPPRIVYLEFGGQVIDDEVRVIDDDPHNLQLWSQLKSLSNSLTDRMVVHTPIFPFYTDITNWHLSRYKYENWLDKWSKVLDDSESFNQIIQKAMDQSNETPVNLYFLGMNNKWIYKGICYTVNDVYAYTNDEFRLLILDEFDKERVRFERLKQKHDSRDQNHKYNRPRIPESVRAEIWRRDGGKCARCGSRVNLEYDHIVPISKGGSNTARNIELLCEKCNRSKSDNVA